MALLVETSRTYGRDVLKGVNRYLAEHEHWSLFFELRALDSQVPRWLASWRGDGIIARTASPAMAEAIAATALPGVELRASKLVHKLPFVGCDNSDLGRIVADHFIDNGFAKFAVFDLDTERYFEERRDNFRASLAARGHECHEHHASAQGERPANWERHQGDVARWVKSLPKPIGIFACTDQLAFWLLDACRRAGVAVPEEVAVVGAENYETLHACVTDGVFVPAAAEAGCDAPPTFIPARPITQADLAVLAERVRRRVIRWFRLARLLDAAAAADMLSWDNSGFSVDASVQITLVDRDVPSYFRSLEHLLRYCARPPFALERLSVIRGPDGRIARIRYVLPRHKAANWVGPGRGRKSTRPGANGVVELTPFEFLDRLADLVPPPRKHRHRYHGVFAPNHKLRKAVTALAIGNIGKPRDAGHAGEAHATGCCDTQAKPRSHDTSRIAWAKLMARVGEEFPLECPNCGGDIRLIAFITEPGPIRKILAHLGEPLEPPPVSPARGPPADWGELVQIHDDRDVFQAAADELPAIDIHSL
ncbi:MAG: substrate-binding domain-containing protein [Planctomycetota bacterium]